MRIGCRGDWIGGFSPGRRKGGGGGGSFAGIKILGVVGILDGDRRCRGRTGCWG